MTTYQKHNSIFARGCWTEPLRFTDPRVVFVVCPTCIAPRQITVPIAEIVDGAVTADVDCACCGRHDPGATLVGFDLPEDPPPPQE